MSSPDDLPDWLVKQCRPDQLQDVLNDPYYDDYEVHSLHPVRVKTPGTGRKPGEYPVYHTEFVVVMARYAQMQMPSIQLGDDSEPE